MTNEELRLRLAAQGWKARELPGFIGTAGPLWTRREAEGWAYGLLATARHLNPAGVVHGGALLTLLDHAISTVAWEACGRTPCVTLQIDAHFLGPVCEEQFAEARASVTHRTGGLAFLRGHVTVDGVPALEAQAIMKMLPAARPAV